MESDVVPYEKKKTLKKVRRNFLNKISPNKLRENQEEKQEFVIDVPKYLKTESFNTIDPYFGLVEKNRKLYFGIHYISSNFNFSSITIDQALFTQIVTISFQQKEGNSIIPCENGIKRLESYGDLDLATVGWKLKNHNASYPALMAKYFELIDAGDPDTLTGLRNARNKASLLAKDLERKYIYKKAQVFLERNACKMVSISYSKEIIQEFGLKIEEFVDWVRVNGLPCFFKGNTTMYLDMMNSVIDCGFRDNGIKVERPEFLISYYDKDGNKKDLMAQNIKIMEPFPEGILVSSYILIKGIPEKKKIYCELSASLKFKMSKPSEKERDTTEMETIVNTLNDVKFEV